VAALAALVMIVGATSAFAARGVQVEGPDGSGEP
jgi:hypothetical protein